MQDTRPPRSWSQTALALIGRIADAYLMGYPGGKGRLYPRIIGLMPPHRLYVEPFAGGAVVARVKRAAQRTILVDRDPKIVERLRGWAPPDWDLRCDDALSFLKRHNFEHDDLLYCDPPYVPSTRRSKRPIYRFGFGDKDHEALLEIVASLPCRVVLSGYRGDLYDQSLRQWRLIEIPTRTRAGAAIECIWFNFDPPMELHDERFIGATFRERQDVRRRLERIRSRVTRLSPPERRLIHEWLGNELLREQP